MAGSVEPRVWGRAPAARLEDSDRADRTPRPSPAGLPCGSRPCKATSPSSPRRPQRLI